jgi:hypothetical protein
MEIYCHIFFIDGSWLALYLNLKSEILKIISFRVTLHDHLVRKDIDINVHERHGYKCT